MAEGATTVRKGAARLLRSESTLLGYTLTIQGTPTITVYDSSGEVVTGYNGVSATGWTNTASETVQVYYRLDTDDANLVAGQTYTVVFSYVVLGSDVNQTREEERTLKVTVSPLLP